ncbi:MAG: hypothetical protein OHK0013_31290 [Sandaracinaceae bacterium]
MPPVQLRALLLAALLVGLVASEPTQAQTSAQGGGRLVPTSPVPQGEIRDAQARFGALRASPSAADVAVESERLIVRCEPAAGQLARCEVEARWTLRASTDRAVALYASAVALEDVLLASEDVSTDTPSLQPLELSLAANAPREVVLRGRARLRATEGMMDGITARHMALATPLTGPHATLLFTRAVERTFARVPESITLHGTVAEGFSLQALDMPSRGAEQLELDAARLGGRANVPLRLQRDGGFFLRHGGPFLGLGGTFDRGFRGRLGYELGLGELLIVSVAADSDFTDVVTLGAIVELATPSWFFPPSVFAGVGYAHRWAVRNGSPLPRTSGGLRLEVGAVLAVVGIVGSFDYFPDDGAFTASLLGRISL